MSPSAVPVVLGGLQPKRRGHSNLDECGAIPLSLRPATFGKYFARQGSLPAMSSSRVAVPDVFTVREIARAAGVRTADVRAALDRLGSPGQVARFFSLRDAVRLVRSVQDPANAFPRTLFAAPSGSRRRAGMPVAVSGALHAAVLAVAIVLSSLGLRSAPAQEPTRDPVRLVFLATPGPGGGGGGGGLRERTPPAKARLRGRSSLKSPVAVTKAVARADVEKPAPPKPLVPEVPQPVREPVPAAAPPPPPVPPVVAPVVSAPADPVDQPGVIRGTPADAPSHGPGGGGGTGSGTGTGNGEGNGAGIGAGSIAGTGGGPYRPGSGISPPQLLNEVKPDYSEEGRRRSIEGDVVLEVVVRADGRVGAVRILQGLGSGLDARAVDAVRQWTFSPARRFGAPVDVLVEVAVEFRLR